MDLFNLAAKITLDSSEYESGLQDAETKANGFGQNLKGGLGKAAKIGAGAVAAIGTASAIASTAFVKGVGSVAAYGDNIDKMSQKMGMSSDAYQEWDAVMRHSGTSMETMKASMKTLANAAENGSDAFDKLGISQEQIANMSQEELFEATITALQGVEDETERTYLAGKTLGRGATELGALLNTSAEDTEKMRKRTRELGGVMSKQAVKAAAKYQDSLQDMQTAMSGLKNKAMAEFLPSMTTVMDGITEVFAGNSDKGIGMITSGIDSLVNKIGQKMPKILEIGGKLFSSFSSVIAENLPKVITAAVGFITTNLPGAITGLLKIAIPAITSLVTSVAKSIPTMLNGIWSAIKASAPALLASVQGIAAGIPGAVSTIISSIGGWITSNAASFASKGGEIWSAIVGGISSAIDNIGETLAGIGSAILTWINGDGLQSLTENGTTLWEKIKEGFSKGLEDIGQLVMKIIVGIGTWITTNYDSIAQAGKNILSYIVEGVVAVASDIATGMLSLIGAAATWIVNNKGAILTTGKTIVTYIINGIITAVATIGQGFVSLVSNIASWVMEHSGDFMAVGQNVLSWIVTGIRKWISDIKEGFDNTVSKIKEKIDSLDFGAIGLQIIKKIKEAIGKWLSGIGAGLMGLPGKLVSYVRSNLSFESVGNAIVNGIKKSFTGISGLAEKLIGLIQGEVNKAGGHRYTTSVHITAGGQSSSGGGGGFAKALHKPYLFNKSTVFGKYQGEDLIAGEAGPEMLLGVNKLNAMLFESVQGGMQSMMGQIYDMMSGTQTGGGNSVLEAQILDVLQRYLPDIAERQVVLDTGAIAGAVAPGVNAALGTQVGNRRRYNA